MVSKVGERERETGLVVVAAVEEKEEEVEDAPKFNDVLAWLLGMCLRRPQEERISGVVLIRVTVTVKETGVTGGKSRGFSKQSLVYKSRANIPYPHFKPNLPKDVNPVRFGVGRLRSFQIRLGRCCSCCCCCPAPVSVRIGL